MSTRPPPPPPYVPASAPPRPPPPRRRPSGAAIASVAVVAVVAFAAGVVVGRQGDDDTATERSGETTAGAAETTTSVPARSSTTEEVETTEAPASTAAPGSGPPLPFTAVDAAVHPADVAALRVLLDQFGFPTWWPVPDAIAPASAPFPTVQRIRAKDGVSNPGRTDAFGSSDLSTEWLLETTDLAVAEATWVQKLSAEMFEIDTGVAEKNTTTNNGVTEVSYSFDVVGGEPGEALYVYIRESFDTTTTERVGTVVSFNWSVYDYERPSPVPIGTAPGKQFLGLAPASPEIEWHSTEANVSGGLGAYGTYAPDATFTATWNVQADDFDAAIAFLSDPANFTGDLQIVSTGVFSTDEFWEQPMGYQGLIGEYTLLKPDPGDSAYLTLEFRLE